MPTWIRLALVALGIAIVGLGLVLGWIACSWVSDGLIHSTRYAAVSGAEDPGRFWLFVCTAVLLAACGIAAGCYLLVSTARNFQRAQ